jgi:hypothetical protein
MAPLAAHDSQAELTFVKANKAIDTGRTRHANRIPIPATSRIGSVAAVLPIDVGTLRPGVKRC